MCAYLSATDEVTMLQGAQGVTRTPTPVRGSPEWVEIAGVEQARAANDL